MGKGGWGRIRRERSETEKRKEHQYKAKTIGAFNLIFCKEIHIANLTNTNHRNLHIVSLHSPFEGCVGLGGAGVSGLGGVGGLLVSLEVVLEGGRYLY